MKLLLTILLLACTLGALTQNNARFEKFTYRQGLSHQNVRFVFTDRQGFLWVGTDFGLNRYDGTSFQKWYAIPGDSNSLPHNLINSISQDRKGYMWIATGNGIARMDMYTGRFNYYGPNHQVPRNNSNHDYNVYVDSNDEVWIGTEKGIFVLDSNRVNATAVKVKLEPEGDKLNNFVYDFTEYEQYVYASTSYGLYRIHKKTKAIKHYLLPIESGDHSNINAFTRITSDGNGIIWIGSWFKGLCWFDTKKETLKYGLLKERYSGEVVKSVIADAELVTESKRQQLYLTSQNGLLKLDVDSFINYSNNIVYRFGPDPNNPDAISHSGLSGLCKDAFDNLWVGSDFGLNKLKTDHSFFHSYSYKSLVDFDYPPNGIVPTTIKGLYWILSRFNNLLYESSTHKFTLHPFKDRLYSQRQLVKYGSDYYSASKYGLLWFDSSMKLKRVFDTNNTKSLAVQHFNRILADSKGNIWLGTFRRGIVVYNTITQSFISDPTAHQPEITLNGQEIETLFEDKEGNIWIGTSNGAIRYQPDKNSFSSILLSKDPAQKDGNYVNCFYQTLDGKLLIGTRDGLYEYNTTQNDITRIALIGQGISNTINQVQEDSRRNIWICSKNGLLVYNPGTKKITTLTQPDGLPVDELYSLFYKFSDTCFAVGSENTLILFNPLQLKPRRNPPSPVFSLLSIDDQAFSLIDQQPIILKHNQSISVDFLSPGSSNIAQHQYQYLLEGLDETWKNTGNGHSLRFSNLPAGKYTLKIKAAEANNEWSENSLALSFAVKPPFYKTWWFLVLFALAIASIIYAFYSYRLSQAIALERLRTRIATDLHDDIGATLSSISFYSEAVKQKTKEKLPEAEPILEKMGETSRTMVSNMSDIVWAINPKNDAAESLVKRMYGYAAEICQLKNVQLQFEDDSTIEKKSLPIEVRKNIYLIFKEAVNNALKYSGCSILKINLTVIMQQLSLTITDNGNGFDPLAGSNGNGLMNMRKRASELKGTINIHSVQKNGTKVQLTCPLP